MLADREKSTSLPSVVKRIDIESRPVIFALDGSGMARAARVRSTPMGTIENAEMGIRLLHGYVLAGNAPVERRLLEVGRGRVHESEIPCHTRVEGKSAAIPGQNVRRAIRVDPRDHVATLPTLAVLTAD